MANSSISLFQHETDQGPAKALLAAGIEAALGEGIRASYAIMGIKAGRFRVKYKGVEHVVQKMDPDTKQYAPVSSIEVVIVKANPFLNKQYYAGKYVEGSNSPPDCYSLDGKVPSPSIAKPVFSNCTLCPKNQYGSMISETGVKQKACRDTKKLAIVPLGDLRNEQMGGPMLFRVPPSSLKDLSSLADALKARGYPYNSVAVRIGFDLEASHPKPIFNAIRPLSDAEAEVILELFHGDGVSAVLSDNDVVVEAPHAAETVGQFEQEPTVPVGSPPLTPVPVTAAQPGLSSSATVQGMTQFVAPAVAPPPPGMGEALVQPFTPGQAVNPPTQLFAPPRGPGRPRKVETPAPAPIMAEPQPEPTGSTLEDDIAGILTGLSAFTGK